MILGIIAAAIRAIISPFTAEAVDFDGVNDYLSRSTDLTGQTDGKEFTLSYWVRPTNFTGTQRILTYVDDPVTSLFLSSHWSSTIFRTVARNAAGTVILQFDITTFPLTLNTWSHILMSVDLATSTVQCSVDGVLVATTNTTVTDDLIDWTGHKWGIGDYWNGGTTNLNANVSELWFDDNYLDLSIQTNIDKFISGSGVGASPVNLGFDGSTPTGTAPSIYFTDDAAVWNAGTNASGKGDFTMTGAVTDSVNEPVELSVQAVDFDGTNDHLTRAALIGAVDGKQFTFSCWVYSIQDGIYKNLLALTTSTSATWKVLLRTSDINPDRFEILARDAGQTLSVNFQASAQRLSANAWNHILVSVDTSTTTIHVYVNDVFDDTAPLTLIDNDMDFTVAHTDIGHRVGIELFKGDMAELFFATEYMDLSVEANRRKFITSEGKPGELGSDGSTPTGTQPLIYCSGGANIWNAGTNRGSGGDFTMTGAVTDSANEPVEITAQAVDFDGTNDYLQGTVNASSGKQLTISYWYFPVTLAGTEYVYINTRADNDLTKGGYWTTVSTDQTTRVVCRNSSAVNIFSWIDSDLPVVLNTWNHLLISFDLTDINTAHWYVNDQPVQSAIATFTNDNIAFEVFAQIGNWNGGGRINSDLSELYIAPNEYLDLSIEANRRKFISDDGKPVNLGSDGSTPTGTPPLVYFSGDASVWNAGTNRGSGGDLTMTGAVTDSTNEPVELP